MTELAAAVGSATGGGRVVDEYCGDSTGVPSSGSPTLGGVAAGEATGRGAAFLVEEVVVALADRDPRRAGGVTVRVRARADKLPLRLALTARRAARADSSSAVSSSSMVEVRARVVQRNTIFGFLLAPALDSRSRAEVALL